MEQNPKITKKYTTFVAITVFIQLKLFLIASELDFGLSVSLEFLFI